MDSQSSLGSSAQGDGSKHSQLLLNKALSFASRSVMLQDQSRDSIFIMQVWALPLLCKTPMRGLTC